MKLKTTRKQLAPCTGLVSHYLDELIDYGGIPSTGAQAILDMQRIGLTQPKIDRWLQGYELGCRIRERHARLTAHTPLTPEVRLRQALQRRVKPPKPAVST